MSILVVCQCGKRFKTSDQYAGKRAKCPGCGKPLTVPLAAPVVRAPVKEAEDDLLSLAEPEVFQPAAVVATAASAPKAAKKSAMAGIPPQSKRDRKTGAGVTPSVTISPAIVVMIILAILIPSAIFWAKEGPMKAEAEWTKISAIAEDNIVGQITRAIQYSYKNDGFDMSDMKFQPKALNVLFDTRGFMLSMPDSVSIQGRTTEGEFHGQFHPKTWRFEVDVPVRGSANTQHVTGSASERDQSLDVDGKAVKD